MRSQQKKIVYILFPGYNKMITITIGNVQNVYYHDAYEAVSSFGSEPARHSFADPATTGNESITVNNDCKGMGI